MSIIHSIFNIIYSNRLKQIDLFREQPFRVQEYYLFDLLEKAKNTEWGKRYRFDQIHDVATFQTQMPVQTYESIKPYIDRMRNGEQDILWPGLVKWFAKSSGTTGDKSKFIPVTKESLQKCHYQGGKDVLAVYGANQKKTRIFTGKTLTLGGSHRIDNENSQSCSGDLSAILIQNIPAWANLLRTPPIQTALISDWDTKLDLITQIAIKQNVVAFTGVPSWNMVLMKHILDYTGKDNLLEVWPHMELFIHGGVSFAPYQEQYRNMFPSDNMHYMETYNASEGFFALQDEPEKDDMLLMLDYGIFYEFIPLEQIEQEFPKALTLEEVQVGHNYAMVITTNSGLWRYMIGDTISFTSLSPYKIKISGRTKQFINAFGEEVIVDNAERALKTACHETGAVINEYTAGPIYMDNENNGAHEWLIEFEKAPSNLDLFTQTLDKTLCSLNSDYEAKRSKNITLRMPLVRIMPKGTFFNWMKKRGKLGGQHKVPRLANNRKYLDDIVSAYG